MVSVTDKKWVDGISHVAPLDKRWGVFRRAGYLAELVGGATGDRGVQHAGLVGDHGVEARDALLGEVLQRSEEAGLVADFVE